MSTVIDEQNPVSETTKADHPLYIKSDRNYRFPPTMRACAGSMLRIKPDGIVSYHNPNVLKYHGPGSQPFHMPVLKARTDKPGETFGRLKTTIEKRAARDPEHNLERFNGRPVFDGFQIVATDGHTALIQKGTGSGEYCNILDKAHAAGRLVCSIVDSEFHLALKRAMVLTAGEKCQKVRLIATHGELKLTSQHSDIGESEETLESNTVEPWHITIDARLLEPLCGIWPLFVWYVEAESPIIFECPSGNWQYVVMPIKDNFKPEVETDPGQVDDIENSNGSDQEAQS